MHEVVGEGASRVWGGRGGGGGEGEGDKGAIMRGGGGLISGGDGDYDEDHQENGIPVVGVLCPYKCCPTAIAIDGMNLSTSTEIDDTIASLQQQCDLRWDDCNGAPATKVCPSCKSMKFCEKCFTLRHRTHPHKACSLSLETRKLRQMQQCPTHCTRPLLEYMCDNCKVMMCVDCMNSDKHTGHSFQSLRSAEKFTEITGALRKLRDEDFRVIEETAEMRKKLKARQQEDFSHPSDLLYCISKDTTAKRNIFAALLFLLKEIKLCNRKKGDVSHLRAMFDQIRAMSLDAVKPLDPPQFKMAISLQQLESHTTPSGVMTLAGTGLPGYVDGPALQAKFRRPFGVAIGPKGNIVVADRDNHCIRQIFQGFVTTIAGQPGVPGHVDGDIRTAQFNSPSSVTFDLQGNILVSDQINNKLRMIIMSSEKVVTIGASTLDLPVGIALDPTENIVVADQGRHSITWIGRDTGFGPRFFSKC
ncbi:hypothetical protein Pelo_15545 [Pelomyxa schiedti]|nr:hypothetical protein Pelo_15545 [Pelomyxa schiedti]